MLVIAQRHNHAAEQGCDVLIYDTAGRLQIDEVLVEELVQLKNKINPQEILWCWMRQRPEAVNVASRFDEALSISGSILAS